MARDKEGGRKGTRDVAVQGAFLTLSHPRVSQIKNLPKGQDQDQIDQTSNKSKKMNQDKLKMMAIKRVWMTGNGKELRGELPGRRKAEGIHLMEMTIIEAIEVIAIDMIGMIGDPAIEFNFRHLGIDFTQEKISTIFSSRNLTNRIFQIATMIMFSNIKRSKNMISTKITNQSHGLSRGTIHLKFTYGKLSKWL